MGSRTPTETELLQGAIWGILTGVNTCQPAEVVKVAGPRQVDVQPTLKLKKANGEVIAKPQVQNVPVFFPTGGGFKSTHPLEKGDTVALIYSQRSLDRWLAKGGVVDPADGRKFHASDAIAFAGITPVADANPVPDAMFHGLRDNSAGIWIQSDGKVRVGKPTADAVAILNDVANSLKNIVVALQSAVTATILGPQPLDPATQASLAAELGELNAALTKISKIKV